MFANYLYEIFEFTRINHASDLFIGLAMLKVENPIPDEIEERDIVKFIGRHYEALCEAYATRDLDVFTALVEGLVELDTKESDED